MTEKKELSAREEAIQAIREGGSVVIGGVQFTLLGNSDTGAKALKDLPSEADFALGNPVAEGKALESIELQMASLEEARQKLTKAKAAAVKETPAKEVEVKDKDKDKDK